MENLQVAIMTLLELGLVLWVMQNLNRQTPGWTSRLVIVFCRISVMATFIVITVKLLYDYRQPIIWLGKASAKVLQIYPWLSLAILAFLCIMLNLMSGIAMLDEHESLEDEKRLDATFGFGCLVFFVLPPLAAIITTIATGHWEFGVAAMLCEFAFTICVCGLFGKINGDDDDDDDGQDLKLLYVISESQEYEPTDEGFQEDENFWENEKTTW